MRHLRLLLGLLTLWGLTALCQPLAAQCSVQNKAFLPGEHIDYDLYFNWKFIWVKCGQAYFESDTATYQGRKGYRFDLLTHTNKKVDFFFKMRDTLTCHVGPGLEPTYFRKGAEEGKRYTVDEAWFSYRNDSSFVRQRRIWRGGRIDTMSYAAPQCIFDMLSIFGQARSFDARTFKVGDKIHFPMATGRRVDAQTLIYRGKENIEANNDTTYRCLVFSFVEYEKKDDKMKEKEVITFFVTDDNNHLPVRLDMYLNFGSAKAFLKGVRGNRYPLTCIVKED